MIQTSILSIMINVYHYSLTGNEWFQWSGDMACILLWLYHRKLLWTLILNKRQSMEGFEMSEFKNQAIVITGGSGGMGISIAEAFLKEGA